MIGMWDEAEGCVSDGCDGISMGTGWGRFAWFGELPMGVESVTTGEKGGLVRLELARGGCDCAVGCVIGCDTVCGGGAWGVCTGDVELGAMVGWLMGALFLGLPLGLGFGVVVAVGVAL